MRDPLDQELDDLRRFVAFVNLWCYRKCSANDEERLSVIKFHPTARQAARAEKWICEKCDIGTKPPKCEVPDCPIDR